MKILLIVSTCVIFGLTNCIGQTEKPMSNSSEGTKSEMADHQMMPKVQFSKIVYKSADDFWKTVRQLDKIDKYSSAVVSVDWKGDIGEGGERVCHSPDGKGYFKEKIVAYDESSRSFSYSLLEGAPVKGMTNTMQVVDLGYGKCVLVWWSYYDWNSYIYQDKKFKDVCC